MSKTRNYLGLQSRLNDRKHPKGCMMLSTSWSLLLHNVQAPAMCQILFILCAVNTAGDESFSPLKGEEQFLQSVSLGKVMEKSQAG